MCTKCKISHAVEMTDQRDAEFSHSLACAGTLFPNYNKPVVGAARGLFSNLV